MHNLPHRASPRLGNPQQLCTCWSNPLAKERLRIYQNPLIWKLGGRGDRTPLLPCPTRCLNKCFLVQSPSWFFCPQGVCFTRANHPNCIIRLLTINHEIALSTIPAWAVVVNNTAEPTS